MHSNNNWIGYKHFRSQLALFKGTLKDSYLSNIFDHCIKIQCIYILQNQGKPYMKCINFWNYTEVYALGLKPMITMHHRKYN